jgi:hypothetical protein
VSATPAAPRPVEVELKYRLRDEAAGDRYLLADELAGFHPISAVRSTQMEDRYLDTADGALARAGFAARLRQTAKGTTVSVKSVGRRNGNGASHRREELEGPADRTAGPRDWPHSDARSLILEQCGDAPLVELVTIRQLRRKRKLQSDDTVVEVSLDEVDAVARSRVVDRFVELEVELVNGDEEALARIEGVASADPDLTPSTGSKLESALAAIRATSGKKGKRGATVLPAPAESGDAEDETIPSREAPETARVIEAVTAAEIAATAEADVASHAVADPAARASKSPAAARAAVDAGLAVAAETTEAPVPADAGPTRLAVPRTPGVLLDDHVAEAGRKVLRFHLARMLAKEQGTRDGTDPEDLHVMSVV